VKRLLLILALSLLWCTTARGQSSFPPPTVAGVDPAGSCPNGVTWYNIIGSKIWGCVGNVWVQFNTGGGAGSVTHTGTLTLGQLIVGNGGADIKVGDLSGDATTSGSTVVSVVGINGAAPPANALVTGTNVGGQIILGNLTSGDIYFGVAGHPVATLPSGLPAGTAIGTVDTGSPKITFGTNVLSISQPINIGLQSVEWAPIANEGVTGTTAGKLSQRTTANPATWIISSTSSTTVAGVCNAGCGTVGSPQIVELGSASCVFDGSTTSGDYVGVSTSVAGDCTDLGASFPTTGAEVVGIVNTTNVGAGTYTVDFNPPDLTLPNAGGGGGGSKGTKLEVAGTSTKSVANLVAGSNITLTPVNSGNTTNITIAAAAGAGVQSKIPLEGGNADTSGCAAPNVFATNYPFSAWSFTTLSPCGTGNTNPPPYDVHFSVRVPHNYSANGKIVVDTWTNDGTAGHTYSIEETDTMVSTTLNAAVGSYSAAQTCTTTSTAYAPCTLTFTTVATPVADGQLLVNIRLSADASMNTPVIFRPYFQWDGGL